jgi:hypothetical protein
LQPADGISKRGPSPGMPGCPTAVEIGAPRLGSSEIAFIRAHLSWILLELMATERASRPGRLFYRMVDPFLVGLNFDTLSLKVARGPATRVAALDLARE